MKTGSSPHRSRSGSLPSDLAEEPGHDRDAADLSQQIKGRRCRAVDKAWAHRMLLLRAGDTLTQEAAHRLKEVFVADDPIGMLQAVWKDKEQLRALLRTGSLEDAAAAKSNSRGWLRQLQGGGGQALPQGLQVVERDRGADHYRRDDGKAARRVWW